MKSYREIWADRVSKELQKANGFPGVVASAEAKGGRFIDWHLLAMPELAVSSNFELFIEVAIGAWSHPYKELFLSWAEQAAELALTDPRFDIEADNSRKGWKNSGSYPGNHGVILGIFALVKAMKRNSEPMATQLIQAAKELETSALNARGQAWNTHIVQGGYLRAVQFLMIAGQADAARAMLTVRRSFKYVDEHRRWLQNVLDLIPEDPQLHTASAEERSTFEERFDVIRDPDFRTVPSFDDSDKHLGQDVMQLRLDLALIRQRYVLGETIAGRWEDVFYAISA
ncbi:hypothetical protein [Roseateles sp.]|uniref:hypothetical protein n=1 Tax=Roseateles sp. TaxID=1971397 RepID=UPI0031DA6D74